MKEGYMAHSTYKNSSGIRITSTTEIINKVYGFNKQALMAWTRKMALQGIDPKQVSKTAADTGTLVHKYIECYIKQIETDKELNDLKSKATFDQIVIAERGLSEYKQIEELYKIKTLESEYVGVNEDHQYGYTVDQIADMDGTIVLNDFKTSKTLYLDHIIQVAAYYKAVFEKFNISQVNVIHIKKDFTDSTGNIIKLIPIPIEMIEIGWSMFTLALDAYKKSKLIDVFIEQLKERKEDGHINS